MNDRRSSGRCHGPAPAAFVSTAVARLPAAAAVLAVLSVVLPAVAQPWGADRPPPGIAPGSTPGQPAPGEPAPPVAPLGPGEATWGTGSVDAPEVESPGRPGRELGGYFMLVPQPVSGFDSEFSLSPGVALALGGDFRWHASLGFMYRSVSHSYTCTPAMGCWTPEERAKDVDLFGVYLEPATIGIPIVLYDDAVTLAIEPLIMPIAWNVGVSDGVVMPWESGTGIQLLMNYEKLYVALSPVNLRIRWLIIDSVAQKAGDDVRPEFGFAWPIRLDAGWRF